MKERTARSGWFTVPSLLAACAASPSPAAPTDSISAVEVQELPASEDPLAWLAAREDEALLLPDVLVVERDPDGWEDAALATYGREFGYCLLRRGRAAPWTAAHESVFVLRPRSVGRIIAPDRVDAVVAALRERGLFAAVDEFLFVFVPEEQWRRAHAAARAELLPVLVVDRGY